MIDDPSVRQAIAWIAELYETASHALELGRSTVHREWSFPGHFTG